MAHTTIAMTTGREGGNEERPIHLLKPETGRCQPSPSTTVTALSIYSVLSVSSSPTPFTPPQYAYAWGYIIIYIVQQYAHTRGIHTVQPSTACTRVSVYVRPNIDSMHTREGINTVRHPHSMHTREGMTIKRLHFMHNLQQCAVNEGNYFDISRYHISTFPGTMCTYLLFFLKGYRGGWRTVKIKE